MSDTVDPYPSEWTHRLLVRPMEDADERYDVRAIEAENAVLRWMMTRGTALRVLVWEEELSTRAPTALEALRSDFRRVSDDDRLWDPSLGTEFHRSLEDDVRAAMQPFEITTDAAPTWRLYDVKQITVVTDDGWLYHSTPDEIHVRNCTLAGIEAAARTDLWESITPLDGVCLFARSDAVTWEAGERQYGLRPGRTDVKFVEESSERTGVSRLDDIAVVEFDERELTATLTTVVDSGESVSTRVHRVLRGWIGHPAVTTLHFPDSETMRSVRDSLERIADECGYDVRIRSRR